MKTLNDLSLEQRREIPFVDKIDYEFDVSEQWLPPVLRMGVMYEEQTKNRRNIWKKKQNYDYELTKRVAKMLWHNGYLLSNHIIDASKYYRDINLIDVDYISKDSSSYITSKLDPNIDSISFAMNIINEFPYTHDFNLGEIIHISGDSIKMTFDKNLLEESINGNLEDKKGINAENIRHVLNQKRKDKEYLIAPTFLILYINNPKIRTSAGEWVVEVLVKKNIRKRDKAYELALKIGDYYHRKISFI